MKVGQDTRMVRLLSGVFAQAAQHLAQVLGECGELFSGGGVEDFQVDRPIAVDDPVLSRAVARPSHHRAIAVHVLGRRGPPGTSAAALNPPPPATKVQVRGLIGSGE
jgi:hypothetical protein